MTPADVDLLERLAIHASCNPCHIARADLVRLLALAGFDHTNWAWRAVLAGADDPVLVMPDAVLMMIEWATTSPCSPYPPFVP